MSRLRHAERWQHTPWTYRRRALTHVTQAAAFVLPLAVAALTRSAVAAILCLLVCELVLVLVAPHVAAFRRLVDQRFRESVCLRASLVRATLLSWMAAGHRHELERLEDLAARVRAATACEGREGEDWLGLDKLLAVFVRLAIAHRESTSAFEAAGPKQLEAQIAERTATADAGGDASMWGARRVAILRDRLEASRQARNEQALLLEQLATIAETVRWTFEQASLGWSSDAQTGVEEAIAHCGGNGSALRELAALGGDVPIDAETLRLGRQRPATGARPHVRVEVAAHPFLGEPLYDRSLFEEPTVEPSCCSTSLSLAKQRLDLGPGPGGGSRAA